MAKPIETNEKRAKAVRAIYFNEAVRWPGRSAGMVIAVAGTKNLMASPVINCDTIFLYGDEFVVDGQYFLDKRASKILTYQYA